MNGLTSVLDPSTLLHPPSKPKTLNLQVNDICNARCVMCRVWQHKRTRELSPAELARLLSDPYFSELEHVGITGGEPTLRKDLDDCYFALLDACGKLTGASFITHGLDSDRAIGVYTRVAEVYRRRSLAFHGMVSIDGIGEVHDRVRGRSHAFERATRTLFGLKMSGVPTTACCTIVATNVWDVWNVLEWGYDKTYIRFRVGEFINRLSNHDASTEIRAFDPSARIALISFFQHLIESYETDDSVKRTYASIVSQLAGGSRLVGCPYQVGRSINLDCRGDFAVCAPKGMPRPLGGDAALSVRAADAERRSIIDTHCPQCIHDYHDDWMPAVAAHRDHAASVLRRLDTASPASPLKPPVSRSALSKTLPFERLLVLGWYGTETIGDLAVLAGIVEQYRQLAPAATFVVPSQYPFFTRVNLERLGLDCRVVEYGDEEAVGSLWMCDTVIIGGGPLMDVPQLAWLATIFERARALGRRTIVEGCGVGPVNLPATATHLLRIARAADEIRLRDRASANRLAALGFDGPVELVADPAARWARSQGIRHRGFDDGPVRVFARELTHEYPQSTSPAHATESVAAFLRRVGEICPERRLELHAMHYFPIGGDDRVYARRLARTIGQGRCIVDEIPRTPLETLEIMASASFVICMRYHSVVFAHAVGAPFLAVDYTDGGKVASYLSDNGLRQRGFSFADLDRLTTPELARLGLHEVAGAR